MIMTRTRLAVVVVLICTSAPFAVSQALARQAGASSPADQLDGFVGDGVCTGKMMAIGKNPGHVMSGRVHGEKTLDGHWAVIHYAEERTASNPKPFSIDQYVGYDPAGKHFVTVLFDNTGAGYATGVSSGWTGNTITFDETVWIGGKRASVQDVFTNGDSGMSSHTGKLRDTKGKWITTDEESCHKA
jgi:hypothetical protein